MDSLDWYTNALPKLAEFIANYPDIPMRLHIWLILFPFHIFPKWVRPQILFQLILTLILVTNRQPVTGEIDSDYIYLRNAEYCNEPSLNHFMMGTVTFDDKFSSLDRPDDPLVKVLITFLVIQNLFTIHLGYYGA